MREVPYEKSLKYLNPKLSKEWHTLKNDNLKPESIKVSEHKKVWWECKEGHEWEATIASRHYSKIGCPKCKRLTGAKKRRMDLIKKKGSLADNFPLLIEEWDFDRNEVSPKEITSGDSSKVHWICKKCKNSWRAIVYQRTGKNSGCPKCSKIKSARSRSRNSVQKKGSILVTHPHLVKEWDFDKNKDISIENYSYGSNKKIWWKCKNGHEWITSIAHRTIENTGCPTCFNKNNIFQKPKINFGRDYPALSKEWHPTLNESITVYDVSSDSKVIYWWKCQKNDKHVYECSIIDKTKDKLKCPYCTRKKVLRGESFAAKYPELMEQWDYTENKDIDPFTVFPNTKKEFSWKCNANEKHKWKASCSKRVQGRSCPYCAGKKVIKEESFGYLYPNLVEQWHPTKNSYLNPYDLTSGSGKKAWWICDKNIKHVWDATVASRTNGQGCPYCVGKKVDSENNLAYKRPDLLEEWDWDKNKNLDPNKTYYNSGKKVWWICKANKRHSWQTSIYLRVNGSKCHYCTKQKTLYEDSLEFISPDIAKQWHSTKNKEKPSEVPPNSSKKIMWVCEKGHEWKTTVTHRTSGTGCPTCNLASQTSFPEQAIYYYCKRVFLDAENKSFVVDKNKKYEMDVYVPSIKFCIEFDGPLHYMKKRIAFDERKNEVLKEKGLKLIRLRDERLPDLKEYNASIFKYNAKEKDYILKCLIYIRDFILNHYKLDKIKQNELHRWNNIDIEKDSIEIRQEIIMKELENSLEIKFPQIAKEWHPIKNGDLKPLYFPPGSHQKIWWLCDKGHEWFVSIKQRTLKNTGCPYCKGQRATKINNLARKFPKIAMDWDYEKNKELRPEDFTPFNNKKVWWKCDNNENHKYYQSIIHRVKGVGCPYCYDKKTLIVTDENSLYALEPEVCKEWHPIKNGDLSPNFFARNSNKKVWWQCEKGHEWEAYINNRVKGQRCPYCAGKKVSHDNNLAVLYPEIASQWHPTKNGSLKPTEVLPSTNKKIWWICSNKHEWEVSLNSRNKGDGKFLGCPYCSGHKTSKESSIISTHSKLLEVWDYYKNKKIHPENVSFGSEKKVYWHCKKCKNDWVQTVIGRVNSKYMCPKCKRNKD